MLGDPQSAWPQKVKALLQLAGQVAYPAGREEGRAGQLGWGNPESPLFSLGRWTAVILTDTEALKGSSDPRSQEAFGAVHGLAGLSSSLSLGPWGRWVS